MSRSPNLDPEALRTFVAVAQLRSFSAAADLLHKTTSAISYRIKSLEDSAGVPLLQRTTRTVTLTPAGEVLLTRASQIFDWMQSLPRELEQANAGVESELVIVVNNLLHDSAAMSELLAHLHERFPYTTIKVRFGVYMGVWDELVHNGARIGIGAPGFHTINDDFATLPLGEIRWVFVVAPSHPLARQREPLGNDALRPYPAVNVEDTSQRMKKRTAWRLPGQQELLVPDLATKIACHERGLGVGFLPAARARAALRAGTLVERTVSYPRSSSPLSLAWPTQGAGAVTAHIRELFATRDRLALPFLSPLAPPAEAVPAAAEGEEPQAPAGSS
ncbi:LysR family transcriptional activator of the allD operon [Rubrivivax gelatinosus]|uniref:HTH-type transcriptional activator AllS n=1 Tax=Rubrivivax gelatinosus TaxID=28068 RepID=UPI0018CAB1AB|nr:HTH-type transcriptional activator AllS [Rubrivivax gelatinosus]MBG6080845.1 LysR family transcriptional activator of the allD operon [Rubrivivax gelatinosus]